MTSSTRSSHSSFTPPYNSVAIQIFCMNPGADNITINIMQVPFV